MKFQHALAALIAGSFAVSASAQNLKPGLWEVTNKVQPAGGSMDRSASDMQQQMAGMKPEQRKMVEEMMAKQGMKMGAGGPGEMSVKTCMTREMAERNELPAQQGDCKTTKQQRSGNTINMVFSCANPPSTGEGQFTVQSPEAYTMKMAVTSAAAGGKPRTMNVDSAGKWIAADCGSVKPMKPPAGKK
jgi:hypothetical protein